MFRKILIVAMFATAAGYCFAAQNLPQVVTSEVFYTQEKQAAPETYVEYVEQPQVQEFVYQEVPAWPLAGSDADVTIACEGAPCSGGKQSDNIRIVSKIGDDLVVENNINMGVRGDGWSGGANMLHGTQIPVGFADECASGTEMPLLNREMLETDGGEVLSVSRSGRKNCAKYADGYAAFAAKTGMQVDASDPSVANLMIVDGVVVNGANGANALNGVETTETTTEEITVNVSADAEPAAVLNDQVRSWVVANGQTLREVLQNWCDKEGWDLVWTTSREYPIEASAVFKGRFVDVASALVRNFGRATPVPYAKFYKGNRVLVISTGEE